MDTTQQHGLPHGSPHEPTTLDVRGLVYGLIGLSLLVAGSFLAMWLLIGALTPEQTAMETAIDQQAVSNRRMPKLNPNQRTQRIVVEERQEQLLRGYSLPSEEGFARIPIERAMQLTVDRYQSAAGALEQP